MARTKATVSVKAASVKSSKARANAAPPPSTSRTSTSKRSRERKSTNPYAGANPYQFWETPAWQKPITNFFKKVHTDKDEGATKQNAEVNRSDKSDQEPREGSSKEVVPRRLRILDSSIEEEEDLPELDGEDSHKIVEYFPTLTQTNDDAAKDKENRSPNDVEVLPKLTGKRDLDRDDPSQEEQQYKKVKTNDSI